MGVQESKNVKEIHNYDKKVFMKLQFEYTGFNNFYLITNICVTYENYQILIFLMGRPSKPFCRKLNLRKQVPKLAISDLDLMFPPL